MGNEILNEQIILNDIFFSRFSVNEETRGKTPGVLSTVEGSFMDIGAKNRNGRIYSISLVENKVLGTDYTKEMLRNKILLGEGRHPQDRFEIWATEASHNITDLWISEDKTTLMGRADILDTPNGRIIQTLVDYGSSLGVSARASGKLTKTKDGFMVDEESYNFKTFDFVTNPGFESSRVSTVNESAEDTDYLDSIYVSVRSLIEDVDTDASTLGAVRSIIESVDYSKIKELLTPLNERLDGVSTENTNEIAKLLEETTVLNQVNEDLTKEFEVQVKLNEELALNEKDLRVENLHLRSVLEAKDKELESLSESNQELSLRLEKLIKKIQVRKSVVKELQEEIADLEECLITLDEENTRVAGELEELLESNESLSKEVLALMESLSEKEQPIVEAVVEVAEEPVEESTNKKQKPVIESIVDSPMSVEVKGSEPESRLVRLVNNVYRS